MTDAIQARIATKALPLIRDDGTRSGFTIGLPDDYRDEDFIAVIEGVAGFARFVSQQKEPQLTLVRTPLPEPPAG